MKTFKKFIKNKNSIKYIYHGTPRGNLFNILKTGLIPTEEENYYFGNKEWKQGISFSFKYFVSEKYFGGVVFVVNYEKISKDYEIKDYDYFDVDSEDGKIKKTIRKIITKYGNKLKYEFEKVVITNKPINIKKYLVSINIPKEEFDGMLSVYTEEELNSLKEYLSLLNKYIPREHKKKYYTNEIIKKKINETIEKRKNKNSNIKYLCYYFDDDEYYDYKFLKKFFVGKFYGNYEIILTNEAQKKETDFYGMVFYIMLDHNKLKKDYKIQYYDEYVEINKKEIPFEKYLVSINVNKTFFKVFNTIIKDYIKNGKLDKSIYNVKIEGVKENALLFEIILKYIDYININVPVNKFKYYSNKKVKKMLGIK